MHEIKKMMKRRNALWLTTALTLSMDGSLTGDAAGAAGGAGAAGAGAAGAEAAGAEAAGAGGATAGATGLLTPDSMA